MKSSVCQRQTGLSHGQPALRLPLAALDPGLRAAGAQGCSGDMQLGCEATAARQQASRFASLAGRCPAPHTAPKGRGLLGGKASWPGFYRRSATGLTARRSGRVPCIHRAQIAVAPAVPRLAPVFRKTPEPVRVQPARRQLRESRSLLLLRCKTAKPRNSSQLARGKYARRQLRGSRAAIGSGGKKARPF